MVFKSIETSPTIEVSSSFKSSTSDAFMELEIDRINAYFAAVDGSFDAWDKVEPLIRSTFHPDVVFETNGREIRYKDFVTFVSKFVSKGGVAELESIFPNSDGTVTIVVSDSLPGEPGVVIKQCTHFKEGKVIRVTSEESHAEKFVAMVNRVEALPANDIETKYKHMIACFDGSPEAFAMAEPIIDDIFDAERLVIVDGHVKHDFAWFKRFVSAFAEGRNVALLEKIEKTETGIRVKRRNVVGGVDQGPVEQFGLVENGKIVHWIAAPSDVSGFSALLDSVTGRNDKISMIKDYFSGFDGSQDAWVRFEPKLRRTIHPDLVIEADGKEIRYDSFVSLVRDKYMSNRCVAILEDIQANEDGTVTLQVNNHLPGEVGEVSRQRAYFKDGRIVRVVDDDTSYAGNFADMLGRVKALPCNIHLVVEKYRVFLEACDGSSDARAKIEPMFDDLFASDFVFVTGEDGRPYEDLPFFKEYVGRLVLTGHRTSVESVRVVAPGQILIDFFVEQKSGGSEDGRGRRVKRTMTVRNGKVVHSMPAEGDEFGFIHDVVTKSKFSG